MPTTAGVEVLDGATGTELTVLSPDLGFQNSPLVTDDPNGDVGITVAGYDGSDQGEIRHYEITGSDGAAAVGPTSWPMFHHDPQRTGVTGALPSQAPCAVPSGAFAGIHAGLVGRRGLRLRQPVLRLGGAPRRSRRRWWRWRRRLTSGVTGWRVPTAGSSPTAAAPYEGSMGGVRLAQPDRRHGGDARRAGLLARGRRRGCVRLRRRRVLRLGLHPAPVRTHRGHRPLGGRAGLLARGRRRRGVRLRRRRVLRIDGQGQAARARRGSRRRPRHSGLLARGRRRRRVRLRRTVPRLVGRATTSRAPW